MSGISDVMADYPCPRCVGTGSLESSDSTDDRWWDCRTCNGTGRLKDRRRPNPEVERLRDTNENLRHALEWRRAEVERLRTELLEAQSHVGRANAREGYVRKLEAEVERLREESESRQRALDEATRELENRRSLYITRDATEAPEGIEAHIGHRLSLTGGDDAPLGLFCDTCGEYLIEWDDAAPDITALPTNEDGC